MTDWDNADKIATFLGEGGGDDPASLYCIKHDRWEPCRICLYSEQVPAWEINEVVGDVLRDHGVDTDELRRAVVESLCEKFSITLKSPSQRAAERRRAGE